ncbi:MAG: very short patch repair endonuclease [Candidatus Nanoarchaeia archaeon]|nr:very short patch repair endonuclease [Candidatus Nanoarchaeia archaeon]
MADIFSKHKRSQIMSQIKSKNTSLELDFRRRLWKEGLRYKTHYAIEGKPDIAFVSRRIAIFIDSCFWHNCPSHFRKPSSNKQYWDKKIKRNALRDKNVTRILTREGWQVLRFWEHDIIKKQEACIKKVKKAYHSGVVKGFPLKGFPLSKAFYNFNSTIILC